jgi:hypothetical protein
MTERIYCAAIWYVDLELPRSVRNPRNVDRGVVVLGHRHGDVIKNVSNLLGLRSVTHGEGSVGENIQGFLTNLDRFVDREEAAGIALAAGQVKDMGRFNPASLYSEDIY